MREEKRTMVAGREQARAADCERTTTSDAAADLLLEEARERECSTHTRAVGAALASSRTSANPRSHHPHLIPNLACVARDGHPKDRYHLYFKGRSFIVFM